MLCASSLVENAVVLKCTTTAPFSPAFSTSLLRQVVMSPVFTLAGKSPRSPLIHHRPPTFIFLTIKSPTTRSLWPPNSLRSILCETWYGPVSWRNYLCGIVFLLLGMMFSMNIMKHECTSKPTCPYVFGALPWSLYTCLCFSRKANKASIVSSMSKMSSFGAWTRSNMNYVLVPYVIRTAQYRRNCQKFHLRES